jgi:hypothetical protein
VPFFLLQVIADIQDGNAIIPFDKEQSFQQSSASTLPMMLPGPLYWNGFKANTAYAPAPPKVGMVEALRQAGKVSMTRVEKNCFVCI